MAVRNDSTLYGDGTTVDAASADLITQAIPTGSAVNAEVRMVGKTAGGAVVVKTISAALNNVTGTLALTGAALSLLDRSDAALAAAVGAVVISGNSVVVRVTGVLTQTVTWYASLRMMVLM